MSVVLKNETDLKNEYQEYLDKGSNINSNYKVVRWGTYWDRDIALCALAAALIGSMILPFEIGFIIGGLIGYTFMADKKSAEASRKMQSEFGKLNQEYSKPIAGIVGEESVNSVLKSFDVYVLNDVKVRYDMQKTPSQIDTVVCGAFGVLCIETKNLKRGIYFSNESNPDHWCGEGMEIYSPQKQAKGHVSVLVNKLRLSGIKNAAELVKPVVVLANNDCIYMNNSKQHPDVPVLSLSELQDYLAKDCSKPAVLSKEGQRRLSSLIGMMCEK